MPQLIIRLKDRVIQQVVIETTQTTIGRDESCDVVLDNPSVSRIHASIIARAGSFYAVDHDSANGIQVNGTPRARQLLNGGDQLQVGKFQIEFSEVGGLSIDQLKSSDAAALEALIGAPVPVTNFDKTTALSARDMLKLQNPQLSAPHQPPSSSNVASNVASNVVTNVVTNVATSARIERLQKKGLNQTQLLLGVCVVALVCLAYLLLGL